MRFTTLNSIAWGAVLVLAAILASCTAPTQDAMVSASHSTAQQGIAASHDLAQDEAAGGHTLRKHVGRTNDELRQRLSRERNIAAASTYTDRETAEKAIGMTLEQNREKIRRWLERSGHPNLVLDYSADSAHPIGRTLRSGEETPRPCSHAVVVLRWTGDDHYYVLTSYPECRE